MCELSDMLLSSLKGVPTRHLPPTKQISGVLVLTLVGGLAYQGSRVNRFGVGVTCDI